jgi:transaldolase
MKIFLDTASVKEIREIVAWGVVDGVTTNPSLLAKEQGSPETVLREICDLVEGPISAEVIAQDLEGMLAEGRRWASVHTNIVVKVPMTLDGLKATKVLSSEGHRVNVTLVFQPAQALLAAKAGAYLVSPFVGRLDDVSTDGIPLIRDIVTIFRNYRIATQVLAASLRHPVHVVECAKAGADVGTMPASVLRALIKHPLTDIGLARFLADWEQAKKELGR